MLGDVAELDDQIIAEVLRKGLSALFMMQAALEKAGVVFIHENGGGAGVRLSKPGGRTAEQHLHSLTCRFEPSVAGPKARICSAHHVRIDIEEALGPPAPVLCSPAWPVRPWDGALVILLRS